jgi:hypothetical protein
MRAAMTSAFVATALALPVAGHCGDPRNDCDSAAPVEATTAVAAQAAHGELGAPLSSAMLDDQRGGDESLASNVIVIDGEVTGNTANNVETGANVIQHGSFADSSGISTVVQNTGSNVLIQSATILNVEFAEP